MFPVRLDLYQPFIVGRNIWVAAVRHPLMWLAWRLGLPYEMVVLAEPQ
jgi:hypothetical protein